MKVIKTEIENVLIFEPAIFEDDRGFFYESYNKKKFTELTGIVEDFVQDNHSKSIQGVIRGLHFQKEPCAQGKLVRCIRGSVFDVIVDIRPQSETYGKWIGIELTEKNKRQIWIPAGFAHGFQTLSLEAEFLYKTTDYYSPKNEKCIIWNDETLNINWPLDNVILSEKDSEGLTLKEWQQEMAYGN